MIYGEGRFYCILFEKMVDEMCQVEQGVRLEVRARKRPSHVPTRRLKCSSIDRRKFKMNTTFALHKRALSLAHTFYDDLALVTQNRLPAAAAIASP